jgi:Host cell surface-exposed lipoprotein
MKKKIILIAGGVFVGILVIAAIAGSHSASQPLTPPSTIAAATAAASARTSTSASPTTPAMTSSEQQAVESVQSYLSDGEGFSYQGLLQQLTSSYGSGFSESDAKFALSYLNPDWNSQAVIAAKSYLSDGEGFSKVGLFQQLTSSYGSGFTTTQADYALSKVGM